MKKLENSSIMFIIDSLNIGGAPKMVNHVAKTCSNHLKKVFVVSLCEKNRIGYVAENIEHISFELQPGEAKNWRIKSIIRLSKVIKEKSPDIVCSFTSEMSVIGKVATIGKKVIYVSAERGDPYSIPPKWLPLVKWAYSMSDFCLFQLEQARDYFDTRIVDKSFIIPNAYVPSDNAEPYYGERKKTIVSVGRLEKQKGYDVLIDAFFIIHKTHPEYKLIIYGEGSQRSNLETQVEKLHLTGYISFPGYIANSPSVIREDGVFVLSSRFEGIPNTLIEAMSVGLPCVATDCTPGGAAFLCNNCERGLIVKIDDVEGIAASVNSIISNKKLQQKLNTSGPEIRQVLDNNKIEKQWIETFKIVLNGKRGE